MIILSLVSIPSLAGQQTGTVADVVVRASDGLVYFYLKEGNKTASPTCATAGYWMIKDENSNAGKHQFSMVLAAQASGKTVHVSGSNSCTRWHDGEDVDWIQLKP